MLSLTAMCREGEVTMSTRRGKPTQREEGLLAHVQRSGAGKEPLTRYCRANGLNVQSVYNLRSRLARNKAGRRQALPKRRKAVTPFVAVRVATPLALPSAACRLRVKGWAIEC